MHLVLNLSSENHNSFSIRKIKAFNDQLPGYNSSSGNLRTQMVLLPRDAV